MATPIVREIKAHLTPECAEILTPEALDFVTCLHVRFNSARKSLLQRRAEIQRKIDSGVFPDFLPETRSIRESSWRCAPIPKDLLDRRVEITGPVDRKMVINALNSGAQVYMADFEDSHSPTWEGTIAGQKNLKDAVRREISFVAPEGKVYSLHDRIATLFVRPRGLHLEEKHVFIGNEAVSASLFDFGLFFFHNARELIQRGSGPYFYLPKLESHWEARFWNEVFLLGQDELGIPRGTIRATVLIETILAAFEMDEILFELKDHSVGLNCGRWDYIFSFIKKFRKYPEFVMPDRAKITMDVRFLNSYSRLLIQTCHRRGVHAMGGMAAQIPIKNDPEKNAAALEKVRADKQREVLAGHDGTWVAHPGLVAIARQIFDAEMKDSNQITRALENPGIIAADLLAIPSGSITEKGLRSNINVALLYLESWLKGVGCVPLYDLMEDAATAEISRAQIWQWIRHPRGKLEDGRKITVTLFRAFLEEELAGVKRIRETGVSGRVQNFEKLKAASDLLDQIIVKDDFSEFLTLPAYEILK